MTAHDALIESMRAIVARVVEPSRTPPPAIGPETPLTEGGLWLDSTELLELIVACETEFEVTFEPAKDLLGDSLETLGSLAALIRAKNPRLPRRSSAAHGS